MFTQTVTKRVLGSGLIDLLTGPHGVDRYTELVTPTWSLSDARAKVVSVEGRTPRSVTLTLAPNDAFRGFKAGQHVNLTVEIDGRRHTRCYSPASAEGSPLIELTVGLHDGGLVSTYLHRDARPGMVVGLDDVGGEFVLPQTPPRRILFVSGGSGITPVMSMLRTLTAEGYDGEIAFVFSDSSIERTDDGWPLLDQAEAAGLTPASGCRMGICHTCTRRKTRGVVKNLITGAVSAVDEEDVQICVSVPVGDVAVAL